jgi:hypothetical protein
MRFNCVSRHSVPIRKLNHFQWLDSFFHHNHEIQIKPLDSMHLFGRARVIRLSQPEENSDVEERADRYRDR